MKRTSRNNRPGGGGGGRQGDPNAWRGGRGGAGHDQGRARHHDRGPRPDPPPLRFEPGELDAPAEIRELLAARGDRAPELERSMAEFIELLLDRTRTVNLTGDREPAAQWLRHIGDALVVARQIEQLCSAPGEVRAADAARGLTEPEEPARILDVGAGGGVPGLVWASLWPNAYVDLLEATGKKVDFLNDAIRTLGLARTKVLAERAEKVAHRDEHREQYDWVSTRALAPLPTLVEWTLPFVKVGGYVFAIKGEDIAEELRASRRGRRLLGSPGDPLVMAYTRPDGRPCHLIVMKKTEWTPSPYPRRTGIAARSPL